MNKALQVRLEVKQCFYHSLSTAEGHKPMMAHSEQTIAGQIADRLTTDLSPSLLKIEDVSWQHAGHAGAPDGGQSHFNLEIAAPALQGLSRVAAHRLITSSLAALLAGPVHALQITIVKE